MTFRTLSCAVQHQSCVFEPRLRQKYLEPRLLIVTDPRTDSQAIKEVL